MMNLDAMLRRLMSGPGVLTGEPALDERMQLIPGQEMQPKQREGETYPFRGGVPQSRLLTEALFGNLQSLFGRRRGII